MKKEFLEGKKTYLFIGLGAIVFILSNLGMIEPELASQIYIALGLGAGYGLRKALK